MRIACLTFTYPRDGIKASIARQLVPSNWEHYWLIEEKHKNMPIPPGVKSIITHAPRGYHLDSVDFCYEYFTILANFSRQYDIVVKLDSDTALYKPDCFIWPILNNGVDFTFIKNVQQRTIANTLTETINGICYALNRTVLPVFLHQFNTLGRKLAEDYHGQEDLVIYNILRALKYPTVANVSKQLIDWCIDRRSDKHTIAGHYGYEGNSNMINAVNEILLKQNRPLIDMAKIEAYIKELEKIEDFA